MALRVLVWLALAYLVLPLAVVLPVSLTDQRSLALPEEGPSLRHYRTLLGDPEWIGAAAQSLGIGVAATALAVSLGTMAALGAWMIPRRRAALVRTAMVLPMIVPSIVFALASYRFYAVVGLLDTVPGVVVAHAIGAMPFVFVTVSASLEQVDPNLLRAARSLGVGPLRGSWMVILPNIRPGLYGAVTFAFLHSWDELVVTLFVSGGRIHTLPRAMWQALRDSLDPVVACMAVLLLSASLLLLATRRGPGV